MGRSGQKKGEERTPFHGGSGSKVERRLEHLHVTGRIRGVVPAGGSGATM
tara:strand:- start:492 stop:641 length:150 start_codon:yes stop_codon:yes gene_type:complete